jgi:hypothetical protein
MTNPRVTSTIEMGLGLLGIAAWILLIPYSALTAEFWGTALLVLAALVLLITTSSLVLVNSYWTRFVHALHWLKLVSIIGVMAGSIGILAWIPWVLQPLCMSSEPIAPGVCPPVPSAAEAWTVLVALILVINVSSFTLVKSLRSQGLQISSNQRLTS